MAEHNEDAKLLQSKLDGLDIETLQQLLQSAIANKSHNTSSNTVDQNTDNLNTESSDGVHADGNVGNEQGDPLNSFISYLDTLLILVDYFYFCYIRIS